MRPNFVVDAGAAKVLRKPKVSRPTTWQEHAAKRRSRAWHARATARLDKATTVEEVTRITRRRWRRYMDGYADDVSP